jgi:PAS domain S-box-containing protein
MRDHQGTTRILIVDDDEDDFRIIGDYIRHIPGSSFRIEWCFRYSDALAHMLERNYDLYLVDYRLGARSGVDLLKEALAHNCAEPVILLTGEGNYKVDIEAMQLGAVDYLIKGELNVEKMERSIRYALERAATMKALKANERRYRSIFEKSRDLIFLTDGSLNIKDANDIALPLLGYTRDEIVGLNLCDLVEQSRQKTFLRQSLLERGAIDDWEVVLTTRAGERKHCMLTASFEKSRGLSTILPISRKQKRSPCRWKSWRLPVAWCGRWHMRCATRSTTSPFLSNR